MSKQPPPAPTASTVGPCPTLTQISRTPRHLEVYPAPSHHPRYRKKVLSNIVRLRQKAETCELHGLLMLPGKATFVSCSIISLGLSFSMKHLVIGQVQKPAKFSAFHWSPSRSQAFIGQLLGTSRVVHIPKRTVMVLFIISDT